MEIYFTCELNNFCLYCICFIAPYLVVFIRRLAGLHKPINNLFTRSTKPESIKSLQLKLISRVLLGGILWQRLELLLFEEKVLKG